MAFRGKTGYVTQVGIETIVMFLVYEYISKKLFVILEF
jgi:hypothetical protein